MSIFVNEEISRLRSSHLLSDSKMEKIFVDIYKEYKSSPMEIKYFSDMVGHPKSLISIINFDQHIGL